MAEFLRIVEWATTRPVPVPAGVLTLALLVLVVLLVSAVVSAARRVGR